MVEIGAAILSAGTATAFGIEWARITGMARIAQIDRAAPGEALGGSSRARRQHAVEEIDAAPDRADNVVGLADAHEIARPVLGERRHRRIEYGEHALLAFADGQTAHGVAVEPDGTQRRG